MIAKRPRPDRALRCAAYTRKSSDEGAVEFSSLDAQRLRCAQYIESQSEMGWELLPDQYDDKGYSGGNMERPALKRLLVDIEAGRIDCVVCYKIDRLTRSIMDFGRLMETFERHGVSFVAVTQLIDTSQSMGRLMLHVLLSFAQFERELVSERTRDKIRLSRERGQWWGSRTPLGYSFDRATRKLVIVEEEAALVREVFRQYLATGSLERTARALNEQGLRTKAWTFADGRTSGGLAWDKSHVRLVITNSTCRGLVPHHDEVFKGEHDAIVDEETWVRANDLLARNARTGADAATPGRQGLLNGLLRCAACDSPMSHSVAVRKGHKVYAYYTCNASRSGRGECPSPSIAAPEIERFVVDRIRAMVGDRAAIDASMAALRRRMDDALADAEARRRSAQLEIGRLTRRIEEAALDPARGESAIARVVDLEALLEKERTALADATRDGAAIREREASREEATRLLREFDPVWGRLTAGERRTLVKGLVRRVDCDVENGKVTVAFEKTGLETLAGKEER